MKTPKQTADLLFLTLAGLLALNQQQDKRGGKPGPGGMKSRQAAYGLIKGGSIAADFITNQGLDLKYREYEKKVNLELSKIVEQNNKQSKGGKRGGK